MNEKLIIGALCAVLMAGCGDGAKPDNQDNGARQYDKNVLARGERLYQTNCASCHGFNGEAKPDWRVRGADDKMPPPPLDDSGHAWHHPRAWLKQMVSLGSPAGQGNMPAWDGKLSEQEIDEVVTYVTSLWSDAVHLIWVTKVEQANPP